MKPPAFSYVAPESVAECLALLAQYGGDAKIMAGGQSLMPLLALRMARPAVVIDIGRIAELNFVRRAGDVVHIGAGVRQRRIEHDAIFARDLPLLRQAVGFIGHVATRSRGTIVGSLCHADPAAELPVCAALLDAELVVQSVRGERVVKAGDFFEGALVTVLQEDELVTEVRFPVHTAGFAFDEIARRHGDFALVSIASMTGRVALGGVAPAPVVFTVQPGETAKDFAARVAQSLEPIDDLHASAAYRRSVAGVLVERVLGRAS